MEIYFSGTWGIITDSEWSSDDAQVAIVCCKLGYFKSGIGYSETHYPETSIYFI